jgi:hypothetical protein
MTVKFNRINETEWEVISITPVFKDEESTKDECDINCTLLEVKRNKKEIKRILSSKK